MREQRGARPLSAAVAARARGGLAAVGPWLLLLVLTGLLLAAAGNARSEQVVRSGGIVARVHEVSDVLAMIREDGGRRMLPLTGDEDVELMTGVDDPRLPRSDVTGFVPLPADVVAAALDDFHTAAPQVVCDIYILPAPPAATAGSFSRGNSIFLSPAFGAPPASAVAELVAHEFGHVLTWAYFDPRPEAWDRYMQLRELDSSANGPAAAHAWRAREILAEDLRYLFGGDAANVHGGIENPQLPLPDAVAGLTGFLCESVSGSTARDRAVCSAYPNPCNPRATIAMLLPSEPGGLDPAAARLRIHDLRGRLIRSVSGGEMRDGRLETVWDGRDSSGRSAPSGRYFYSLVWGGVRGAGTVLLVR